MGRKVVQLEATTESTAFDLRTRERDFASETQDWPEGVSAPDGKDGYGT